jgi:Protein of unknown function (DUF2953)
MKWLLWVLIVLIVVFVLVMVTKIKVKIRYQHIRDNDKFIVKLSAWFGLLRYTIHVPVMKVDADSASIKLKEKTGMSDQTKTEKNKRITPEDMIQTLKNIKHLLEHVVGFHKIIRHFLKKVQVKQFEWRSRIGMGNAAHTAVLVGSCWAIKGSIIGLLTAALHFRVMPVSSITPDFQEEKAETAIVCILRFRIGQAIVTGIKLLRYWKGSKVKWITSTFMKQKENSNNQSM